MNLLFLEVDERLHTYHASRRRARGVVREHVNRRFVSSWIYHDLSLEGSIFRDDELERGLAGRPGANWSENRLLAKVRLARRAIDFIAQKQPSGAGFDLDFVKEIHRRLMPDGDESAGRYRKDGGPSTAYRHDIAAPSGISYRLRRLIAWIDEHGGDRHPISTACEIHRQLIEIFPFHRDNGIVARMAMNAWLLRKNYPPAVIDVRHRQQYFQAYLTDDNRFQRLIVRSIIEGMDARIREFETVSWGAALATA